MRSSDALPHLLAAPLGNLAAFALGERMLERAGATSDDLAKRVLRFATSRGDVGVRLEAGRTLADGDVIYADETLVVALDVAPDEVLVGRPASIAQALAVAHALGNRHLPLQIDGDTLVVRYDRLVEELFAAARLAYARESRKLDTAFRHADAAHGHA